MKKKFAIYIDEPGREKLYLKKLIELIKNDYSFLKEKGRLLREKTISKAKIGDFIIFGEKGKVYDYTTVSEDTFDEYFSNYSVLSLREDFSKVKKTIGKYVQQNYDDTGVYLVIDDNTTLVVDDIIYKDKPTRKKNKKRNSLRLDEVRVFHEYVQVGWDNYDIYLDAHDNEFVVIDGNVYYVDRNSSDKAVLTV